MSFWFCKISFCLDMMQYFCIFPPNFWNTVLYMCVTVPHVAKLLSIGIENLHKTLTLRGGFCSEWVKNLKKTHSLYSYLCFLISNNWLDQKLMSYFLKSQDKISFIFFFWCCKYHSTKYYHTLIHCVLILGKKHRIKSFS